jgi:DNA-binding CsgD family transcriptional regulator
VIVTEVVRRRCRDHVGDERSLRIALVEDLRARVQFAFHVWLLVDPETEVATAPLATLPDHLMAELPGIIGRRYRTTLNRWDTMSVPVDSLDRATDGQRNQSLLHRETLGPAGVGDVASLVFRDVHGCWGFLDLWRLATDAPFSDHDIDVLGEDVATITDALRRCQARAFDDRVPTPGQAGPAVLFLSVELAVQGQTPETDGYLRALLPTDADRQPIPAGAYNVAAALIGVGAGSFDHQPVARVRPATGTWLTFRAARIDADQPIVERDIAVTISASSPAERRSLYVRAHGLTPRETEIVDLLAEGADTRRIAGSLYLSEHTIQDHLKSIFHKTGARNRRTLLARLAGR